MWPAGGRPACLGHAVHTSSSISCCHVPSHAHHAALVGQLCQLKAHQPTARLPSARATPADAAGPQGKQQSRQRPPARGSNKAKQGSDEEATGEKSAPRAPRAQRQLFRALEAMRSGAAAEPLPEEPSRRPAGKGSKKGLPNARQSPGAPPKPRRAGSEDGPADVIVLSGPSSPQEQLAPRPTSSSSSRSASTTATAAAVATMAAAGAAAAASPVVKPRPAPSAPAAKAANSSEEDEGEQATWNVQPSDGEDGAQVWRDRLAQVGWEYDEDEDDKEEDDEAFAEDEDLPPEDPDDLLLEVTPYGTWFAGEGEQPAESAEQQQLRNWYTEKGFVLPVQWGPIKVATLPGRGRGLVATRRLSAGDLLLVSRAAHLLDYEPEEEGKGAASGPENEELADSMMRRAKLSASQHTWLDELLMSNALQPPPRLPTTQEVQALQQHAGPYTPLGIKDAESKQRLYRLINLNCLGEEFSELAVSSLREEDAPGWLGLWPDAALINHACAPNALYWAIGDRLVVRAADDIEQGQEVTLPYLGALLTAPLAKRQAELQDKWGFTCSCARCKAEEKAVGPGSELGKLVDETYEWCQQMSEVLRDALDEEDYAEVADIRRDLQERRDEVEAAMRAAKLSSKARRWTQASLYDLYDMLSLCADEQGSEPTQSQKGGRQGGRAGSRGAPPAPAREEPEVLDTENLAVCARILESVGRGTDAQAYLAAEYMVRAGVRFGAQHHEALEAQRMCKAAFTARFGPVSPSLMDALITARLDD